MNTEEVRNALTIAERNGEDDTITLLDGTYRTDGMAFTYVPQPGENFALTISGFLSKDTLDGGGSGQVLHIDTRRLDDDSNAHITITAVDIINGNNPNGFGGGLSAITNRANIIIERCSFIDNTVSGLENALGGGAYVQTGSGLILLNGNSFERNTANASMIVFGGAVFSRTGSGNQDSIDNTFLRNNADAQTVVGGGPSHFTDTGRITSERNKVEDNIGRADQGDARGGGAFHQNPSGDTLLNANVYFRNRATSNLGNAAGGGAEVLSRSGNITSVNNIFVGNYADSALGGAAGGGARLGNISGTTTATNNTLTLNVTTGDGGGVSAVLIEDSATGNFYNNITFNNNATGRGRNVFFGDDGDGNGIGSPVNISNSIFPLSTLFSECGNGVTGAPTTSPPPRTHCTPNITLVNNINEDPLLVDPQNGDIHLQAGSPAIDAGDPNAPGLPDIDFEGDPRVVGAALDIGADEFVPSHVPPAKPEA